MKKSPSPTVDEASLGTSSLNSMQPELEQSTLGKFNKSMDFRRGVIYRLLSHRLPPELSLIVIEHIDKSEEDEVKDNFWQRYLDHEIDAEEKRGGKEWSAEKKQVFLDSHNNMRYAQEQENVIWSIKIEEKLLQEQLQKQERKEKQEQERKRRQKWNEEWKKDQSMLKEGGWFMKLGLRQKWEEEMMLRPRGEKQNRSWLDKLLLRKQKWHHWYQEE